MLREMITETDDTIAAVATPPGRAALGIVRVSGPRCREIVERVFSPLHGSLPSFRPVIGKIGLDGGAQLDEALVTFFEKPHSYTREDVAEISCHGNPLILDRLLERILSFGARLAKPGEFTYRAFLNGRLDLIQAEAVQDLINADSLYQAELALQHLGGRLSGRLQQLRSRMVDLISLMEGNIDFSEEQHYHFIDQRGAQEKAEEIAEDMRGLLGTFERGRLIREGFRVALVGRPNVGKSSLFNALLGQNRAIVTSIPGTTRDYLSEKIVLGPYAVNLIDTAGIRESREEIEKEGIDRSRKMAEEADLLLFVLDGSEKCTEEDLALWQAVKEKEVLFVLNKSDLPGFHPEFPFLENGIAVSAIQGLEIDSVLAGIRQRIDNKVKYSQTDSVISSLRHRDILKTSLDAVEQAREGIQSGLGEELCLTDLHRAMRGIGEITGEVTLDDIYQEIFTRFCIGK